MQCGGGAISMDLSAFLLAARYAYEKWEDEDSDSTQSDASGPSEVEQRITVSYP